MNNVALDQSVNATQSNKLQQGIAAVRSGDRQTGGRLLSEVLRANPRNEQAWLWMANTVSNPDQKRLCLQNALAINPVNALARQALARLEPIPAKRSTPVEAARIFQDQTILDQRGSRKSVDESSDEGATQDGLEMKDQFDLPADQTQAEIDEFEDDILLHPIDADVDQEADQDNLSIRKLLGLPAEVDLSYPIYPTDLWEYIDDLPYMPSHKDYDQLCERSKIFPEAEKRVKIWEYFFRIEPDDVGKPQQEEIKRLENDLQKLNYRFDTLRLPEERNVTNLAGTLESYKKLAEGGGEIPEKIKEIEKKINKMWSKFSSYGFKVITIGLGAGGLLSILLLLGIYFASSQIPDPMAFFQQLLWLTLFCTIPIIVSGLIGIGLINYFRTSALRSERKRYRNRLREIRQNNELKIPQIKQQIATSEQKLQALRAEYEGEVNRINHRLLDLKAQIDALKRKMPILPSDEEIRQWLETDLERLQQESIISTGLANRLAQIAFPTDEGEQLEVPNPLIFISPGELQDPERIPPPFRPVQLSSDTDQIAQFVKPGALGQVRNLLLNSRPWEQITHALQPKPTPDRARHLLARREISTNNRGYEVLFGVYYIEYLLVAQDMVTMHGFFFDFITGKTTADKITEQYYRDIVAIEKSKEFRTIPMGYNSNKTMDIEDAPAFSLTLPSGERRTVTLVNQEYLIGLAKNKLAQDEVQDIYEISEQAKKNAETAVKTLRYYLRLHKGAEN